jgi:hypothetical protein
MKSEEMKDIIDKYIQAYNTFDVDQMLAQMDPNIEFHNIVDGSPTISTKGLPELRELAENAKAIFKSRCQKIAKYDFEKESASIEINYAGVLNTDVPDGPKAGDTIKLHGRSVFKFKDGKIIYLADHS